MSQAAPTVPRRENERRRMLQGCRVTAQQDQIVGWTVVGPMESVCIDDAATVAEAKAHYRWRWVADVWEIPANPPAVLGEIACSVCGRRILGPTAPTT